MGWIPFKGTAVDEISRWHAFRKDQPAGALTRGGNRNAEPNVSRDEPGLCRNGNKDERCRGAARQQHRGTGGATAGLFPDHATSRRGLGGGGRTDVWGALVDPG